MNQQQVPLGLSSVQRPDFEQIFGHQTVIQALQQPHQSNAVYLWGQSCSGKTHLLSALCHELERQGQQVMPLSGSVLLEPSILNLLPERLDAVLIDDVDVLSSCADSELTLFNVYNHCRSHDIGLYLTSHLAARDQAWQLPDLRSRLTAALQLHLSVLRGRDAWLAFGALFERHGMRLDQSVLQYLKAHHSDNFAQLCGLFMRLAEESLRRKKSVTIPMLKQALKSD